MVWVQYVFFVSDSAPPMEKSAMTPYPAHLTGEGRDGVIDSRKWGIRLKMEFEEWDWKLRLKIDIKDHILRLRIEIEHRVWRFNPNPWSLIRRQTSDAVHAYIVALVIYPSCHPTVGCANERLLGLNHSLARCEFFCEPLGRFLPGISVSVYPASAVQYCERPRFFF